MIVPKPTGPIDVWAMDFVHDQLATGKKLRILTAADTFSRYVPVLDARFSYRGEDVVATLDRVRRRTGHPKTIRVDQGSEFISQNWISGPISAASRSTSHGLEADGQCVHRSLQWTVPGGMSERALVLDACGRRRKVGDLAWILQRRTATARSAISPRPR